MANIGDKFIITIGDKAENEQSGETLYRIKGFKSLVFDENGIEKLEKYETGNSTYDRGFGNGMTQGYKKGLVEGKNIAMLTLADSLKEKYGKGSNDGTLD